MEETCATLAERIPEITELEKVEKDLILQLKLKTEDEIQQNKKLKEVSQGDCVYLCERAH